MSYNHFSKSFDPKEFKQYLSKFRVALVHDYLCEYGGAERVLEALYELFDKPDVYVSFYDKKRLGIHAKRFKNWNIYESDLVKLPFYKKLYSPYRIFAAHFFKKFDLKNYDLVISSTNAYQSKAVRVKRGRHISYCHTPTRSLYGYVTGQNWQKSKIKRFVALFINFYMRKVDFETAQKVDFFLTNSKETQSRIRKFFRRNSFVIYPPVKINKQRQNIVSFDKRDYFLYVNRLGFAKHPDIAIKAMIKANLPLKVVGVGTMLDELIELAKPYKNIQFLYSVDDKTLHSLYKHAKALLYPVEDEDFGMVPIEAMSFGTPVIAHFSGGPKETIKHKKTGVFFKQLSVNALLKALDIYKTIDFDPFYIFSSVQKYDIEIFKKNVLKFIYKNISFSR